MSKAKWPRELPVFEAVGDYLYYVIGVDVSAGRIKVHYPLSDRHAVNNLSVSFFSSDDRSGYRPATQAANEMLAIAKAGAR